MKANSTIFAMLTTIAFSSLFALSPEKVKSEAATLYEIGINLGMGRGSKKDPKMALETMKASARLGAESFERFRPYDGDETGTFQI